MFHTYVTFTVAIPIQAWMGSASSPSIALFLSFIEDIAETLDIKGTATTAYIERKNELWYTFFHEEDKNLFMEAIEKLWREGWWLAND